MATERDEVDRTEAPSPRWATQARALGHWPVSRELIVAASLLAAVMTIRIAGASLADNWIGSLRSSLNSVDISPLHGIENWRWDWAKSLLFVVPLIALPMLAAWLAHVAQRGLHFRAELLLPSADRFNFLARLSGCFSGESMLHGCAAIVKWIALATMLLWFVWREFSAAGESARPIFDSITRVATQFALLLVVLSAAGYGRAWWQWRTQMQMSRAEMVAEQREVEGDPIIRRRRRERQIALADRTPKDKIDSHAVVLVGRGRVAVAISVGAKPKVIERAIGVAAQRLQQRARAAKARVVSDPIRAAQLFRSRNQEEIGDLLASVPG